MMEVFYICAVRYSRHQPAVPSEHTHAARTAGDGDFKLCFTSVHLSLSSPVWLVASMLRRGSAGGQPGAHV